VTAVVLLVSLLAACTNGASEPTPAPDVFAPTPSIQEEAPPTTVRRATTTTVDRQRATIFRVDPVTLEPFPDLTPIPMGDGVWGIASDNGTYFAASVDDDRKRTSELRLIDVANWEQVASWDESVDSGSTPPDFTVANDGTVYFLREGLRAFRPGLTGSEIIAAMPIDFYPWGRGRRIDQDFVTIGARFDPEIGAQQATVAIADVLSGALTQIDLPDVRLGEVAGIWLHAMSQIPLPNVRSPEPAGQAPWADHLWALPAFVLDTNRARALVVHADRAVISEVDLSTGTVMDHPLIPAESDEPDLSTLSTLQRSAALSPDGTMLHIATSKGDISITEASWSFGLTPTGVISVDTTSWEIVSRLEGPIGDIHLSPRGDRLLATGSSGLIGADGNELYDTMQSGLYVLNADNLAVVAHHPIEDPRRWYGSFSFNEATGTGYAFAEGETDWRIDAIDMASGRIVASQESLMDYVQVFGEIAVMSKISE
jgi:hypothetical protein